jgi:4-carboxymuconolactone decarboxylase
VRIPLVEKSEVSVAQRELYDTFVRRVGANYSSFTTMTPQGALLGPWSVWMHAPRTGMAIDNLLEAIEAMTGLSPQTIQAVTLAVGAHFDAAYILYAHARVAADVGLSQAQIAALAAGEAPPDLDPRTQLAVVVARRLLRGGVLPGPTYRRAVAELGADGVGHLVYLVGQYCLVAMSLNAYDVPDEDTWPASAPVSDPQSDNNS